LQIKIVLDSHKSYKEKVYSWNEYETENDSISLLQIIENDSDAIRQQFLNYNRDIVCSISKKLKEYFSESSIEYELFISSLFAEKSPLKSPCIVEALRLIALERELQQINCKSIRYIGPSKPIANALGKIAKSRNLQFFWERTYRRKKNRRLLKQFYLKIPILLKAILFYIRFTWKRWGLRKVKKPDWFHGQGSIFFLSYFIHLNKKSCEEGKFYSNHWEALPDLLRNSGLKLNWMHIFFFSPVVPSTQTGADWIKVFNNDKDNQGLHIFLSSFLSLGLLLKMVFFWMKIVKRFFLIDKKIEETISMYDYSWLWPVFRQEWVDSFIGKTAIHNLFLYHLFDKAIGSLPHQKTGLYLMENQGWERIFIKAWRKHGHGRLIGVAHSIISYWDLRYHESDLLSLPKPDKVAINGPVSWKALEKSGFDMDICVPVEALRYLHLNGISKESDNKSRSNGKLYKILLLGDIRKNSTHKMLKEVEKTYKNLQSRNEIWLKPHPGNPIDLRNYPKLKLKLVQGLLGDLLLQVDLIISTVFTSSALDAYCSGIPVISCLDSNGLNLSILRDIEELKFTSTSDQLEKAIEQIKSGNQKIGNPTDFFWLDSALPRWEKLLRK
jgi:surface carbohydrate biosynthesis protein (TIGR04326 family)